MYVSRVSNRHSPPAYLPREGYCEGGQAKSRTFANIAHWPMAKIKRLHGATADPVTVTNNTRSRMSLMGAAAYPPFLPPSLFGFMVRARAPARLFGTK